MIRRRIFGLFLVLIPMVFAVASEDGFISILPEDIVWSEAKHHKPNVSILAGNPQKAGFYLVRVKFPPGVMSPPHHHSTERHITVISGTWYFGSGPRFDKNNMTALKAGSYMTHPAGGIHYDGAIEEEVIVEIKGLGPVSTTWLDQ